MSNMQFYIAVAIPSVLVILSWIQSNSRANDLKESLQRQLSDVKEGTNRELSDLKTSMDRQFEQVNRRLDRIDDDLKHFHNVTGVLEGRID